MSYKNTVVIFLIIIILTGCLKTDNKKEIIVATESYSIYNTEKINEYLMSIEKNYTIKTIDLSIDSADMENNNIATLDTYVNRLESLEHWDLTQALQTSIYEVDLKESVSRLNLLDLNEFDLDLSAYYPKDIILSNQVSNTDYILPGFSMYSNSTENFSYMVNKDLAESAGVDISNWGNYLYNHTEDIIKIYEHYNGDINLFSNPNSLSYIFPGLSPINGNYFTGSPYIYNHIEDSIELLYDNKEFHEYQNFFKYFIDLDISINSLGKDDNPLIVFNPSSLGIYLENEYMSDDKYIGKGSDSIYINRYSMFGLGVNKDSQNKAELEDFLSLYLTDKKLNDLIIFGRYLEDNTISVEDYFWGHGNIYSSLDLNVNEMSYLNKGYMFNKTLNLSSESWDTLKTIQREFVNYSSFGLPFWELPFESFMTEISDIDTEELLYELENQ